MCVSAPAALSGMVPDPVGQSSPSALAITTKLLTVTAEYKKVYGNLHKVSVSGFSGRVFLAYISLTSGRNEGARVGAG